MYSSCAFLSASPAGPGNSMMPKPTSTSAALTRTTRASSPSRATIGTSDRCPSPIDPSDAIADARTAASGS